MRTPSRIIQVFATSLATSLGMMRLDKVDLFILHSHIVPDSLEVEAAERHTPWSLYREGWIPAVTRLQEEGLCLIPVGEVTHRRPRVTATRARGPPRGRRASICARSSGSNGRAAPR